MNDKKREWNRQQEERLKPAYAALMSCYPFTLENLDGEEWRRVDGFDGYQVSSFGRVKSFKQGKKLILKPCYKSGYLWFTLGNGGKRKFCVAHRLVAEMFISNPDDKEQVNHIDGYPLNNHVSNLEWTTSKENMNHAIVNGLQVHKEGTECYQALLTNELAEWILSVHKKGDKEFGATALARKLGISKGVVLRLVHGKTYQTTKGERHAADAQDLYNKVPEEIRRQIRAEFKSHDKNFGGRALAKKYNLHPQTISHIVHEE